MTHDTAGCLVARPVPSLQGRVTVPGDKSISHRALIIGALSIGETPVSGLLEGEDVLRTAEALRALGVPVSRGGAGVWTVRGRGIAGLSAPEDVLDFGNSGTGARLMMGVLAGHPFTSVLTGDGSLRSRPMERVLAPLRRMGLEADCREGGRLPARLTGASPLMPIRYETPVPSAQVKSAVLLAGLHAPGETTVVERAATRDHTERMLARFGAAIRTEEQGRTRVITITGQPELIPQAITVPADPSSAAFPLVAGLIVSRAEIVIEGVLMNPLRIGLIATLQEMGADLEIRNQRTSGGEPVADLLVRGGSPLKGVEVPPERAPSMIDEYPILAVAAAFAEGKTVMHGLSELRVKESDRLDAMARGLKACGLHVDETQDSLSVLGCGAGGVRGSAMIDSLGDHRIAMAFLVLGSGAQEPVTVQGTAMIATSFPGFAELMESLGAVIESSHSLAP